MKRYLLTLLFAALASMAAAQTIPADTTSEHEIHEAIDLSSKDRMKADLAAEQAKIDS